MSYSIIGDSSKICIFAFVVSFVIVPTFFVIFSGCITPSSSPEEYTGILFDSVYDEGNNDLFIFFDEGKKQVDIYSDSDEFSIMRLNIIIQHNIGHKARIVYTNDTQNKCTWFELLD